MSALILICILTWNVEQNPPPDDLETLLDLPPPEGKSLPDLYVIGLQEMKYFSQNWEPAFKKVLKKHGYKTVRKERLHEVSGIMIQVFALKKHKSFIREIESKSTATGFYEKWGNKGATTVCLTVRGIPACFVNAHLKPHEGECLERLKQVSKIECEQGFSKKVEKKSVDNELIFWHGDLNFRLQADLNMESEEIISQIYQNNLKMLWEKDELNSFMTSSSIQEGEFLRYFREAEVNFPPTYKFEKDTNKYEKLRRPAWTDRILYKASKEVEIIPIRYTSVPEYSISDHKPVLAEFQIKRKTEGDFKLEIATEEEYKVDIKTDGDSKLEIKTEGDSKLEMKTEGDSKLDMKTEGEYKVDIKTEGDSKLEIKTEGDSKLEMKTEGDSKLDMKTEGDYKVDIKTEGDSKLEIKTEGD